MQSPLRRFVEELNVHAMATGCHRTMGIDIELLKDAILGVLAAILGREQAFAQKFPSRHHFFAYVRKAATREALRRHQQRQRHEAIDEVPGLRVDETPESQLLAHEAALEAKLRLGNLREVTKRGLEAMGKSAETIGYCEVLIDVLLSAPEQYLTQRMSGKDKGALVVDQAKLVAATGWNKRRISERLRWLQRALQVAGWEVT